MDKLNRAQALRSLFHQKEWKALASLALDLKSRWTSNQNQFSLGASIEAIAIERVRWASKVEALENLFSEINNEIDGLKNMEAHEDEVGSSMDSEEETELKKEKSQKIESTLFENPYRSGGRSTGEF